MYILKGLYSALTGMMTYAPIHTLVLVICSVVACGCLFIMCTSVDWDVELPIPAILLSDFAVASVVYLDMSLKAIGVA